MESSKLALCIIFLELGLCWAFTLLVDYTEDLTDRNVDIENNLQGRLRENHPRKHLSSIYFYMFQDAHLVLIIGFGFLTTFLKRYGFRSAIFSLVLAITVSQWAILCQGFFRMQRGKICIGISNMLNADFASAATFISFGVVLHVITPLQSIIMAVCEIIFFATNEHICLEILQVSDVGMSMLVHLFGAYYGLAVGWVLRNHQSVSTEKDNTSQYPDNFNTIGTLYLWLFWPNLNGSLAGGDAQHRAIINTFYSLTASTVVTYTFCSFLKKHHLLNAEHIQNASLAGGVAIGTAADMMIHPFGAIVVGSISGIASLLGNCYVSPEINKKFGIRDWCGVHNLHGIPGLVAAIVGAVAAAVATEADYTYSLYRQFPARTPLNTTVDYWSIHYHVPNIKPGLGRSGFMQGAYQIFALGTTLTFALIGGILTGFVLRVPIFGKTEDHLAKEQPRNR